MVKKNNGLPIGADTEPEKSFWLCDGRTLKNLRELAMALESMDEGIWGYHVTAEKNDFANWVEDVYGEKQLGASIRRVKSPATAAKRIETKLEGPKFWSIFF